MLRRIYQFLSPKYQTLFLEYPVEFRPRYGNEKSVHAELYKIINANRGNYRYLLSKALDYKEAIWRIKNSKEESDLSKPSWNNGYLPGLDIIGLYTLFAECKPKRYIEIGSGNSTKVAYKAKSDLNLQTEITSIDPQPRAEIDKLTNRIVRKPFECIDFDILQELDTNDILFIDGSHRILPNSDSMVFYLEVLPKLRKGVIVHIHDVYLPYDYPQFMCNRFYSEQYGLAMYLLANPKKFDTILPNYFIHQDKELSEIVSPIWNHRNLQNVERHGGSFWLRINE